MWPTDFFAAIQPSIETTDRIASWFIFFRYETSAHPRVFRQGVAYLKQHASCTIEPNFLLCRSLYFRSQFRGFNKAGPYTEAPIFNAGEKNRCLDREATKIDPTIFRKWTVPDVEIARRLGRKRQVLWLINKTGTKLNTVASANLAFVTVTENCSCKRVATKSETTIDNELY